MEVEMVALFQKDAKDQHVSDASARFPGKENALQPGARLHTSTKPLRRNERDQGTSSAAAECQAVLT